MPLINTSLPNLIQGVSQQSDATRFSGQCELQENAISSVTEGLVKRGNTQHINRILQFLGEDSFVHFIDRSEDEKYVIIVDSLEHKLFVFDLLGNPIDIHAKGREPHTSVTGLFLESDDYLRTVSLTPREALKAITISDSTFIVNTERAVHESSTKTNPFDKEALIFIKQGDYDKIYGFDLQTTVKTTQTLTYIIDGTSEDVIASDLVLDIKLKAIAVGLYGYGGASWNRSTGQAGGGTRYTTTIYHWTLLDNNPITIKEGAGNVSGGSGFSVGDVITVPRPTSGDGVKGSYSPYPQSIPKIRVTEVGTNGEIINFVVANQGSWTGSGATLNNTRNYTAQIDTTSSLISEVDESQVITSTSIVNETFSTKVQNRSDNGDMNDNNGGRDAGTGAILSLVNTACGAKNAFIAEGTNQGLGLFTRNTDHLSKNLLVITATDKVIDFSTSPFDDLNGLGIGVVHKEVASITELPLYAKNNFKVKVRGDASLGEDDFYVKFQTTLNTEFGTGAWIECIAPEHVQNFNENTVPVELISERQGYFSVQPMVFEDRNAGDDNTNPMPSFSNQPITNIFFFKNRIGFLSRENVIMSEAGLGLVNDEGRLAFNFSRKTVTSLLDDAPIDVSISSNRVTSLNSAVGFQENLILFADSGQFVLKGGELLTPKTISISPVTNFEMNGKIDPLLLGSYIYFPFERAEYSGIREYTVNSTTDVYDSVEVTEHVPAYVPKNIIHITGSSSEDMLAIVSSEEPTCIYVYSYFWSNKQKVLSSWSKFRLEGVSGIRGMAFIDECLYAVVVDDIPSTDNKQTHIIKLQIAAGQEDKYGDQISQRPTLLDMRSLQHAISGKFSLTGATSNADSPEDSLGNNAASFNGNEYDFSFMLNGRKGFIHSGNTATTASKFLYSNGRWYFYNTVSDTITNFAVSSKNFAMCPWGANWAGTDLENATFTQIGNINKIYLPYKQTDNAIDVYRVDGTKVGCSSSNGIVTLDNTFNQGTNFWVGVPYTMKYTFSEQLFKAKAGSGQTVSNAAKVLIRNGSLYYDDTYNFNVKITPKDRSTLTETFDNGKVAEDGFFRFPVFTTPEDTNITVENNSIFPSKFQSAEFESFVHNRSSRYG